MTYEPYYEEDLRPVTRADIKRLEFALQRAVSEMVKIMVTKNDLSSIAGKATIKINHHISKEIEGL